MDAAYHLQKLHGRHIRQVEAWTIGKYVWIRNEGLQSPLYQISVGKFMYQNINFFSEKKGRKYGTVIGKILLCTLKEIISVM